MRRPMIFVLTAFTLTVAVALGAIPTNTFTICTGAYRAKGKDYLIVRDGTVVLDRDIPRIDWSRDPAPGRWFIEGTRIKSTLGEKYLAYDIDKESGRVFLADKPSDATEWTIAPISASNSGEGARGEIRAANGPMKKWLLAVEETVRKAEDGSTATVRFVVLRQEATQKLEGQRIYLHK